MKISLSGLRYVDYWCFNLPSQIKGENLTGVLAITGVESYFMHESTLIVRYDMAADACDLAAQTLLVIVDSLGVELDECVVEVNDKFFISDSDACKMADEIQKRAHAATMPASIPLDLVDVVGSIPSYHRKG
jgi:hypothetical protein